MKKTIYLAIPIVGFVLLSVSTGATAQSNQAVDDARAAVVAAARANGIVPPALALAVAKEESAFDRLAVSVAGARGIMQIMPETARREFGVSPDELWDTDTNARIGIEYLARLYREYGRDWERALSHYNGGALRVDEFGDAVPHTFTRQYVARVMRRWDDYADAPSVARLFGDGPITPPATARPAQRRARPTRDLLTDMEEARLSFRRALRAHEAREPRYR